MLKYVTIKKQLFFSLRESETSRQSNIPDKEHPLGLLIHVGKCAVQWREFTETSLITANELTTANVSITWKLLHDGVRKLQLLSAVSLEQSWCLISSLLTQGTTQADMSGPREQHSSPDSTAPSSHRKAEKEKLEERHAEEEEYAIADQDADTDSELRGTGEDGFEWVKQLNL